MSAVLRVFFALWPDAGTRDRLADLAHTIALRAHGRAPPSQNLHMTLVFVGEVRSNLVETLGAVGRAAAATVPSFVLALDRIGAFHRQGIAWAGASSPPETLVRLSSELANGLTAQGWKLERRPFHAHVTLARRCRIGAAHPLREGEALSAPIVWNVARAILAASELASGPPRYRELDGWRLAANDPSS